MSVNARSEDIESAFHRKADIARCGWKVRSGPNAEKLSKVHAPAAERSLASTESINDMQELAIKWMTGVDEFATSARHSMAISAPDRNR
jgi:hypothetical protein